MDRGCVVIADIHHNMLEGVRGLLATKFDSVIMVADMESLLEATKNLKPSLVILDLSMPVSGEIKPVEEFLRCFPGSRLIVMSVHDESNVADKIIGSGASGFVLKRQAGTDLLEAVDAVLSGRTFISEVAMDNG
jgi:DNA-binding NarL/FixJ family response regulator